MGSMSVTRVLNSNAGCIAPPKSWDCPETNGDAVTGGSVADRRKYGRASYLLQLTGELLLLLVLLFSVSLSWP